MIGAWLNQYRITASIGAGGMGEVFRARDTRLNREVAIKVLPKDFVSDADRLRRFEQESKTLAALNHPNILTIHDAGVHEGAPYLVSELLEGRTLREEMNGGALPVRKAAEFALQIAHGLAAAHSKGIIHRDLKPENIFVTKDGRVKILDFGLAKLRANPKSEIRNPKSAETSTVRIDPEAVINTTEPGLVLGTPAYMSPEQVRGEPADHRADIFAFGCVLYEMLSGTRAFRRDTPVASMNAVLSEEPPDLSASNASIPPALERIVRRCLDKQPERRFQSAYDLGFAIENAAASSTSYLGQRAPNFAARWRAATLVPWAVAAFCMVGLFLVLFGKRATVSSTGETRAPMRKFELSLGTPGRLTPTDASQLYPSVSPDGQKIVYANEDGLWLRWLGSLGPPVSLVKGENITGPFWSPQSTDVAYFDGRNLMRVSISGTRPAAITTLPGSANGYEPGGVWFNDDRVIVATGEAALYEVPALGGKVTTVLAGGEGETAFYSPTALPGGRGVLFILQRVKPPRAIALWTPDGKRKTIREIPDIRLVSEAVSGTGHVLFDRWDGTRGVWALPFSLEKLEVTGEPRSISNVGYRPSVSEDGTLVCAMGGMQDEAFARMRLVWVDRTGAVGAKIGPALPGFTAVRLSPDGQRAVAMAGEGVDGLDIWLFDVATGQADRLTQNRVQDSLPHWWDGGRTIIFGQSRINGAVILRRPAQAFGEEQLFTAELEWCWAASASTGTLLGRARGSGWGYVSFSGERPLFVPLPEPLQGIADPEFSPDGKRLAYRTAEIGPGEICVLDFPALTNLRQISRGGGWCPQWHPAASELFFVSQDGRSLMAARQKSEGSSFDAPTKVFDLPDGISPGHPGWPTFYSVSPDGQRFLMLQKAEEASTGAAPGKPNALVIMNWIEELREKK